MPSMEKAAITPELVSRLVAAQFPEWADLAVTPVELDGWDNTTFRLGEDLAVRLPSADWYVAGRQGAPLVADPRATTAPSHPFAGGERHPRKWVPGAVVRVRVARG